VSRAGTGEGSSRDTGVAACTGYNILESSQQYFAPEDEGRGDDMNATVQ
jgi:hypothetical protein